MAAKAAPKATTTIEDQEEMYIALMKKYPQLTIDDIANMNQYQKLILYRGSKYLHFDTAEEYETWMRSNNARTA